MSRYRFGIFFILFLTVALGSAAAWQLAIGRSNYALVCSIAAIILFFYTLQYFFGLFQDVQDFTEAVRYKDFSRRYVKRKFRLPDFRTQFNELNDAFVLVNQEKESQQQYLKRILELVDTGILAYDVDTNDILCVNDALINMLSIPRLKNIGWLEKRNQPLYEQLNTLPVSDSKLISLHIGQQVIKTLVNVSLFSTAGKTYRLLAFHNINATLEEIELSAWKGLLRVMTHEIMNSIAPVSSLASTLKTQMEQLKEHSQELSPDDFQDVVAGMEAIKRRSEGLLRFAETYRTLSKTIIINPVNTDVGEMSVTIYKLMQPSLRKKGIILETIIQESIPPLMIDRELMEQVVVNFITNACDAVKETKNPHVIMSAGHNSQENEVFLTVADNGRGIPPELLEKIFIPFFSTKKHGNGIGLSLCRQIVKAHDAQLKIQTKEHEGSAFTVLFKLPTDN